VGFIGLLGWIDFHRNESTPRMAFVLLEHYKRVRLVGIFRTDSNRTMKHKPKFQLVVFAALVCLASCSTPWQRNAIPHKEPHKSEEADVTLTFQQFDYENNKRAVIQFANHSSHDVVWYGVGSGPFYFLQKRGLFNWQALSRAGLCGTGAGEHRLAAGQIFKFSVYLAKYGKGQFQVGVNYHLPSRDQTLTTWSPPFKRR